MGEGKEKIYIFALTIVMFTDAKRILNNVESTNMMSTERVKFTFGPRFRLSSVNVSTV